MATENILIKFTADTSGITKSIDELQKMGKVTEDDAKKLQMLEGIAEGVADALKEAGVDAKTLNKAITDSTNSGKSLRTQLFEAKNEAVKLSKEFGAFSKEAREAAKRAALIKDEIADLNANLDALNPEAKLNAFVNLGQGIQGAFQVATGALQVFGVENERITKLAQQFQGVLNLTQGINSVLQLKDVYTQLRLVLGVTTAAQTGLNTSVAAGAAAAAPLIVAVGVLIAASYALTQSMFDEAEALKKSNEEMLEKIRLADLAAKSYFDFIGVNEKFYALLKAQGATEIEINKTKLKNITADIALLKTGRDRAVGAELIKEFNEKINDLTYDQQLLEIEINKQLKEQAFLAERALNVFTDLKKLKINPKDLINLDDKQFQNLKDFLTALEADAYRVRDSMLAITKELKNLDAVSVQIKKTGVDFNKDLIAKEDKLKEDRLNSLLEFSNSSKSIFEGVYDVQVALREREFQDLKDRLSKGLISEEQYQDQLKKLKQKSAEDDKKAALFSATLSAASAILNALNTKPTSAVPAAVALASILSALNIARIAATPIPQFKKGTLNVGGGSLDVDGGMHAVIHRGEAIIPKDRNKEYHPTIKALYNRQIKASEINAFVQSKLSGKIENRVSADIDVNKLSRAFNKNKTVDIGNSKILGNIIADRLTSNLKRRQW